MSRDSTTTASSRGRQIVKQRTSYSWQPTPESFVGQLLYIYTTNFKINYYSCILVYMLSLRKYLWRMLLAGYLVPHTPSTCFSIRRSSSEVEGGWGRRGCGVGGREKGPDILLTKKAEPGLCLQSGGRCEARVAAECGPLVLTPWWDYEHAARAAYSQAGQGPPLSGCCFTTFSRTGSALCCVEEEVLGFHSEQSWLDFVVVYFFFLNHWLSLKFVWKSISLLRRI